MTLRGVAANHISKEYEVKHYQMQCSLFLSIQSNKLQRNWLLSPIQLRANHCFRIRLIYVLLKKSCIVINLILITGLWQTNTPFIQVQYCMVPLQVHDLYPVFCAILYVGYAHTYIQWRPPVHQLYTYGIMAQTTTKCTKHGGKMYVLQLMIKYILKHYSQPWPAGLLKNSRLALTKINAQMVH